MLDTESRHSTGLDQGPTRDPWLTMDYYLGTDSLSLQEMLDVDIKCEIEGVIGGHPELGFNFTDLSPLELDDDPVGCQGDLNGWFGAASLLNGNSNSSHSGGDAATIMVNPNSVMPHSSVRSPTPSSNNPSSTGSSSTRRHFSFSSKTDIKEEQVDIEEDPETGNDTENEQYDNEQYENDITETEDEESDDEIDETPKFANSLKSKQQFQLTNGSSIKNFVSHVTNGKASQTPQKINPLAQIRVRNFKILQAPSSLPNNGQTHHVRKQIYNNNVHMNTSTTTLPASMKRDIDISEFDEKPYPKPAYSYSCLIAMALKNSQTGSLPVSEIYNFMCEHFPYFKTAPNGWKNSVRHNLSLNKCFEKIEKPAGNGNQRKGCLWAINPAKIAKMDEEVSKWSRKDPLAIKKAMIYPDHLELLERGEMKYAGTGSDLSEETESSGDEATEESTTYGEELVHGHVAANSVTDSYDESSQDCDVDVAEHLYDEIDIEEDNKEAFHMQLNISKQEEPFEYELSPSAKRQKTLTGTLQGNYLYQTVSTSRRKTPLLVRAAANTGTFLKIE
ncbi:uncharacterized protein jumu isoform X2 [Venturia canescens]|uniref:uncharacterized protein jumu isoform X2 n=1 Tax=Venturia canescens TaxID=32260 RepID=UPI001C9D63A7|nr:uncharacterized protein LOC122418866 isoform X2 [Venturia canescens]